MNLHPYPFATSAPAVAAACDRAGEDCSFTPKAHDPSYAANDFTTVDSAQHKRLVHLADIGATVLIEAYARRGNRGFPAQAYDVSTPDEEELPDEKTRDEMAADLSMAAAHLFERGLIMRPSVDKPQLVSFVRRPA